MAANRINQWWMCCQTKEAQNEMLESLFFQYNVKDQQDKLFMSDLVKPGGGSNLPNGIFVLSAKAKLCYVLQIPMDYYGLFRAFAIGQ